MTKQEAIERLRNLQSIKEDDLSAYIGVWYKGIKDDYDEALDMAIEALQRGLENVNADSCSEKPNRSDLIRRQDAIDVAKQHWYKPDIAKALEELPSAQPELIEKEAYIRGFEQGRTQGMIDEQTKVRTQMSSADCISRQDAIEVAKKHWYKPDIAGALAELPSAQLKPKTAESGSVDSEMPEVKTDRTTSGDLISRQAAINALSEAGLINYAAAGDGNGMIQAVNVIKGLPSAQPEIIRCKDCVHNFDGLFHCDRVTFYNKKDDFCSKAKMKRRDEENETD